VNRFEGDKALFVSFCCTILERRIVRETLTESKELNCVDGWGHSNFFRRTFHVGGNHFDNDGQRARLVPLKSAIPIQVRKRPTTLKPHKYFTKLLIQSTENQLFFYLYLSLRADLMFAGILDPRTLGYMNGASVSTSNRSSGSKFFSRIDRTPSSDFFIHKKRHLIFIRKLLTSLSNLVFPKEAGQTNVKAHFKVL